MDRIERIREFAHERDEKKMKEEQEKARRAEALKSHILTLKPRIDALVKIGNTCEANGIPLTGKAFGGHEGYDTHQFFTNSWSHLVGFVKEYDPMTREQLPITKVGIFGGGACDYNLVTDGATIDVKGDVNRVLTRFVNEFDEFEEKFYEYIDKLCGVAKAPEDMAMSKKGNMLYWDEIDNIALNCVSAIVDKSTKKVSLDCFDLTDIYKQVVDIVTERLEKDFGCEFPYVDENY